VEAPRLERKLIAILAADVEGYSRHMERDEAATLATLSAHRVIVDDLVSSYNGRITGTAGDSVLAEFASVVDAVDCAVKIQDALAAANQALPDEHRLRFRIGINVGDVMVKDGDIFGDGVNIAARLESLAEAGGICISRGVRDHVRKMGRFAFEDLGEQSVKNIDQPIRAFRLRGVDATAAPAPILPATVSREASDHDSSDGPALRQQAGPAEEAEFELAFWESIKESGDPAEFAAYLERYPAGAFAALAESRSQALLEEAAVPAAETAAADQEVSAVELAFWDTVKDSSNPEMYSAYLERYPEGAFAALAKVRLEEVGSPSP
jgi:adenylate cyclase